MSDSDTNANKNEAVPLKNWIAVLGVALGAFMAILDIQITNSSLSDIQGALGATLEEGSWIATSYLVAEIVVIPLTALLSRVFSARTYIAANAIAFILFSLLCAFAWDLPSMIAFRALQGLTGGILIPMAFTTILTTLPPSKQPVGLAIFGLSATFAPSIGPSLGGWLTFNYGWKYIFYLNVIPGILLVAAVLYAMPKAKMQLDLLRGVDWLSVLAMIIGLGSLEVVLEEGNRKDWFGSDLILRLAIVAAIAIVFFVVRQLTAKEPFIDLKLLARRNFGIGSAANVVLGAALYGSIFLIPLYLTQIQGYNAQQIGAVLMWSGIPQLFIVPFLPKLMAKFDSRLLVFVGLFLFGVSCLMNAFMTVDHAGDQLIAAAIVRALGQPLIIVPLSGLTTAGIEKERAANASALFNMLRNMGGSFGIALSSTMLTRREQFHSLTIGESVTIFDTATQLRIEGLTRMFVDKGSDAVTAGQQALQALDHAVRTQAYIMSYNDCFFALGLALIGAAALVVFFKKPNVTASASVAH